MKTRARERYFRDVHKTLRKAINKLQKSGFTSLAISVAQARCSVAVAPDVVRTTANFRKILVVAKDILECSTYLNSTFALMPLSAANHIDEACKVIERTLKV